MNYNISITKVKQPKYKSLDFNDLPFGRIFSDHMFVADYCDGNWQNPRIIPFEPIAMHPASMVLHYGQAIFEGMKAFKNKQGEPVFFRPEMHAKRINASAQRLCMPTIPEDLFLEGLHQLIGIDHNWIPTTENSALYIRPFMIATDEFLGVRPSETYKFIIFTCPVGAYYSKPVSLYAEQHYVRAVNGGVGEAKAAGNYAASLLPAKLAQEKGYDQVMWLAAPDFKQVQEVGTMNIFFVIDGKVITPKTDGAILKGITRDSIITLLKDKGIEVLEQHVTIDDILDAHQKGTLQECFGSGTAAVVSPVHTIIIGEQKLVLPDVENAKIATFTKSTIEKIRSGEIEDTFNWIQPVRILEQSLA